MVWRVKEPFSFDQDGVPVTMRAGALLPEGDPRAVGREHLLEQADDVAARGAVETATAAPGERRSLSKGRAGRAEER